MMRWTGCRSLEAFRTLTFHKQGPHSAIWRPSQHYFVELMSQLLNMLDLGVWPNDTEKPWVVGDEIRCPELGVTNVISAICSLKVVP
jgi:hypothetical protein